MEGVDLVIWRKIVGVLTRNVHSERLLTRRLLDDHIIWLSREKQNS
jgi:hypothetical protein